MADRGRIAYEAARDERLSRRPSDEVIGWDELNEVTRGMWEAAAVAVLKEVTAERDDLQQMYEAATLVLALHLKDNCSTVARVRDRPAIDRLVAPAG